MQNISSCDEDRLRIAAKAEASLDLARKLVAEGAYEKGLEHYLYAFDNGRYVDGWGGVRLSYIPGEIARLGSAYPPASQALRDRRDAREELIKGGETDFDTVSEWITINEYLGEQDRMLLLVDAVNKDLREKIIDANFEKLMASKQYKLAGEVLVDRGHRFFDWEHHYECEKYFPRKVDNPRWDHTEMLEYHRQVFLRHGLEVFELALALRQSARAQEVARRLLLHCNDVDTFFALLAIASRVGSKSMSKQLLKKAKSALPREDFARISEIKLP